MQAPSAEDENDRDQNLIEAMSAGDEEALRMLYARHARPLHAIALAILHDTHEAQDALQESFVRIWQQAATYRAERSAPSTWMNFLTRNTAIDFLRRRQRRPVLLESDPGRDECAPGDAQSHLEMTLVAGCMNALPESQRIALELAYFKGCTQGEIAKAMRIPLGNVKNHLKRGLHRLRELYTRHE